MLRFIPRRINGKLTTKYVCQACDIGRGYPIFNDDTGEVIYPGSCEFCEFSDEAETKEDYDVCRIKHICDKAKMPFIAMTQPILCPDYTLSGDYYNTSVFRLVKFEGMPLYVQLAKRVVPQGQCNAHCFFHAWRMANKRTWRQCGSSHLCGNDGSFYSLMAPKYQVLREEFLQQL